MSSLVAPIEIPVVHVVTPFELANAALSQKVACNSSPSEAHQLGVLFSFCNNLNSSVLPAGCMVLWPWPAALAAAGHVLAACCRSYLSG